MTLRLVLIGDDDGVPQLLRHVPHASVGAIVGASIRPAQHSRLAAAAAEVGCPFLVQPLQTASDYPAFLQAVADSGADLLWVNSYSMILRDDLLALPRFGAINHHGALLPEFRGCNPIQWAILSRARETGVTLHKVVREVDAGPILAQERVPISLADTWVEVRDRITAANDRLIASAVPRVLAGELEAAPQDETRARAWPRRRRADGEFHWSQPLLTIYNLVRATVHPHPGAFVVENGQEIVYDRPHGLQQLLVAKYSAAVLAAERSERLVLRPSPVRAEGRPTRLFLDLALRTDATPVGSAVIDLHEPDGLRARAMVTISERYRTGAEELIRAFASKELLVEQLAFEAATAVAG